MFWDCRIMFVGWCIDMGWLWFNWLLWVCGNWLKILVVGGGINVGMIECNEVEEWSLMLRGLLNWGDMNGV